MFVITRYKLQVYIKKNKKNAILPQYAVRILYFQRLIEETGQVMLNKLHVLYTMGRHAVAAE